jgi:hypothetical protein
MGNVFSEFEVDQIGFKFPSTSGSGTYQSVTCIGSYEETMNAKVITKKCRGVVRKKIVKGTGEGSLKISAHIPYDIYTKMYGMDLTSLLDGVKGYGQNSVHPTFSLVAHVTDEDGVEKYKAYPNCVIETGKVSKVENGAEEVAEIELEVSVAPDEYGQGMYEALDEGLTDTVAAAWMTSFDPDLVQKST